jgi:hypothetical protein
MAIFDKVAPASMTPLWKAPKIRSMAEYIVNMHVAGRRYFNFADSAAVMEPCTVREYLFGQAVGSDVLTAFAARDRLSSEHKHLPEEWNLWYRVQELQSADNRSRQAMCSIPVSACSLPAMTILHSPSKAAITAKAITTTTSAA